jgi:hypothetical protein
MESIGELARWTKLVSVKGRMATNELAILLETWFAAGY